MSDKPAGVFARGGDTRKQLALGFQHRIDFAAGIKRALDYYSGAAMTESVPLVPEIPAAAATAGTVATRAYPR